MNLKRIGLLAASIAFLTAAVAAAQTDRRSAYSYVRESTGEVTVLSELNGSVEARRNLPISAGDEVRTEDPARAEIALADGNVLHVGGGTRLRFASLYAQQGSDDEVSAIDLSEGSVILAVVGSDERSAPRVDTQDASVYANAGARVRINADPRRGSSVVVRAGSVEVKTRAGSYTVRAGNYLIAQGDSEPEIAHGSFSRDRFDLWAADRLKVTYDSPRNASSEYVGDEYSGDVASLDGYGDWEYNSTYSTNVWRPRVSAGWSPYSSGSWYYTPIGLTWWSSDPWGWYPNHYGNWFFDAGWNSWGWSPGYVYSPAWVYWGYSGSYLGWCPTGLYGGFSPWWNNYYRNWTYPRGSLAFAINGRFSTRNVDLRGWNFTGASNVGVTRGRIPVVAGTRVVDRLGNDFSVSSRPIVLANRGRGGVREGLSDHIREAPRVIERTSGRDSQKLAPVLARQNTLPRETVDALRDRAVVAERGKLSGPGARDLAPSGAAVVERGSGPVRIERSHRSSDTGRTVITDRNRSSELSERSRPAAPSGERREPADSGRTARPETRDNWRGGASQNPREGREAKPRETSRPPASDKRPQSAAPPSSSDGWRGQPPRTAPSPRNAPSSRNAAPRSESLERNRERASSDWRSRADVPPAQRVIEGAVPRRRAPEPDAGDAPRYRERDARPSRDDSPRSYGHSAPQREAPRREAPSRQAPAPRSYAPRDSAPRHSAPRDYAPRQQAPRSIERAAPAPRQAPQAAPRSAPAPRQAPPPSRNAPSSKSERPSRRS
ncbi:MAG: DUF6600 domain-containing protein [Thermoanaerobaculia bacterium]